MTPSTDPVATNPLVRLWGGATRLVAARPWTALALGVLAVAAMVWAVSNEALRSTLASEEAAKWELHTLDVQLKTQQVLASIQSAESSQRGYLLTGDETYLDPYRGEGLLAQAHFEALKRLTADNPRQEQRIGELERLLRARLDMLAQSLTLFQEGRRAEGITRLHAGKALMDKLRQQIDLVWAEEARLLQSRGEASQRASAQQRRSAIMMIAVDGLLMLVLALTALAAYRAERIARQQASQAEVSRKVQEALETRVREAVADLRTSEAALRQSQKMEAVGQLAGGIAHDFNNMLAIVVGSIEMAQRRMAAGQTDISRFLNNAMEGARRAAALTHRILAYSRQQPLEPKVINVNSLVSEMSELLRRTLGEHIKLETVLAGGLWRTRVDAHQMENVIVNLAVNARDAMPEGGALTIETGNAYFDDAYAAAHADTKPGQYVFVAVTDTGTGMTEEVREKAFEPFFTTKGVGKGSGLGLAQVFGFLKQSGGHINIYSEVGQGTSIKVYLPRWAGEENAIETNGDTGAPMPAGRAEDTVLVVEDDEGVRVITVEALRDLGYTVRHAGSGAEALRLLETLENVTLIFTDIVMPDMNGRQLADTALARWPELKILYTTGYTRNAVVHNGVLDAGVAFLPKPFTVAQLAAKVRQVLDA